MHFKLRVKICKTEVLLQNKDKIVLNNLKKWFTWDFQNKSSSYWEFSSGLILVRFWKKETFISQTADSFWSYQLVKKQKENNMDAWRVGDVKFVFNELGVQRRNVFSSETITIRTQRLTVSFTASKSQITGDETFFSWGDTVTTLRGRRGDLEVTVCLWGGISRKDQNNLIIVSQQLNIHL